jgi:TetR/AcrR family transcriptional repressor of nem operon
MARSKEFDEERALAAAVDVFWRQGYENTSLEALMREMGIARQSLYDTFGDKRALYLKAMAFYRERTNSSLREALASAPTAKEGFTQVLLGLVAESREQHARGCLLLSANMERAVDDEEIARFLEDNQAEVESIFADALRRGQRGDELPPGTDAGALAKFFVATIQGMRAMARLKSDRRALRQVARIALAVFDRYPSPVSRGRQIVRMTRPKGRPSTK